MINNPFALSFDGVGDYVVADLDQFNQGTIEFWVKAKSLASDTIIGGFQRANDTRYLLSFRTFGGSGFGFDVQTATTQTRLTATNVASTDEWTHISGTYDGQSVKMYVNGIEKASGVNSGGILKWDGFLVGSDILGLRYFRGLIDEVRVWNVARIQRDIQTDMSKRLIGDEQGLVVYWRFDEGEGKVAEDSSSNRNDGSIFGAFYSEDTYPLIKTPHWIEPKLVWDPDNDRYNYEDLDRVENNTEVVADLIRHFDTLPTLVTVVNRTMKRIEFAESLNRIEGNQDLLRQRFTPKGWVENKLDWEANQPFDFRDAARLETNLALLYFYYQGNTDNFRHCGMYTCGEDVI